jgi:predicted permease
MLSLPYQDSGALVKIDERTRDGKPGWGATFLDIQQWQQRSDAMESVAFYTVPGGWGHGGFLERNRGTILVLNPEVSGNLFPTLGVHAALGRAFLQGKSGGVRAEDAHSIVLNDEVWRDTFGGDPRVLGRTVKISGVPYTIIGVMPRGFAFPYGMAQSAVVWMPIVPGAADMTRVKNENPLYQTIGRLAPGAMVSKALAELQGIQTQNALLYTDPDSREHASSIQLERYSDSLVESDLRQSLMALSGAGGVLWLIACVNVTSLLLARATARQREIAVRGALGASRWRIVQQLLIEGSMLSLIAAVAGIGLAMLTLHMFERALRSQFNIYTQLTPNLHVLAVLLGLTIVSAVVCSVWPALAAVRATLEPALRQGSSSSGTGRAQHRLRAGLVVAEIAMSLTLLVACGLLLRTIYALRHVPLGFRTDHVMVASMSIPAYKYKGEDMMKELYQPLLERVQHLPGVQSATLLTEVPLGKTFNIMFTFGDADGKTAADVRHSKMRITARAVGPEAQRVFGFHMLRGRFFNKTDTPTSLPGVVVNRAFVREYEGNDGDPGQILGTGLMNMTKDQRAVVIGVMDDERQASVAEPPQPELEVYLPQMTPQSMFYEPAEQMAMDLAVRTARASAVMVPELRRVMQQASPELGASEFKTMDQIVEDSYSSQQLAARLLETFGGIALVLCIAGIYGLLAYLVTQRTRELGIRLALGAQRSRVMAMVLWQAGGMLLCGLGVGLMLAYMSAQLLHTLLYGVTVHDSWTMAAVTLMLLAGGLAAAYVPARRAAGVDPMEALRSE